MLTYSVLPISAISPKSSSENRSRLLSALRNTMMGHSAKDVLLLSFLLSQTWRVESPRQIGLLPLLQSGCRVTEHHVSFCIIAFDPLFHQVPVRDGEWISLEPLREAGQIGR